MQGMGRPYPDDYDDFDSSDVFQDPADEITPRPSQRGAVGIFLIGWLLLPSAAYLLSELRSPWFEVAGLLTLTFIVVFVVAVVRVVKNF